MSNPTITIEAHRDVVRHRDKIALTVWQASLAGYSAGRLVFEAVPEGAAAEPLLIASREDLQRLADSLWEAGVRPMQAEGSAGQLAAVERHLNDMRHLAFAKLDVTRPEVR